MHDPFPHSLPPVIAVHKSKQKSVKFDRVTGKYKPSCFYAPLCNSICY